MPEDQAIEFPAHDKAAGNLHKFAALSTLDKPPHRLDMFETHIVKLRAGKAKRTAQDAAHQCRRPRRERPNVKYEFAALFGSVFAQPLLRDRPHPCVLAGENFQGLPEGFHQVGIEIGR